MQQNFMLQGDPLSLDRIRSILNRLEDTIIFSLIERAQFAHNPRIYERGAFKELRDLGFTGSWLEWFLKETESFHAKARRYTSPDEYPFSSELPQPVLPPLKFPKILYPNNVNANPSILSFYTRTIVPRITRHATLALAATKRANGITGDEEYEDDGNYGSAATIDVEVLQAISKRVHYGKFVSESKFVDKPSAFIPHILNPDRPALEAAQDFASDGELLKYTIANGSGKIDVDGVVDLYESFIIRNQVDYLLRRLDGLTKEEIDELLKK